MEALLYLFCTTLPSHIRPFALFWDFSWRSRRAALVACNVLCKTAAAAHFLANGMNFRNLENLRKQVEREQRLKFEQNLQDRQIEELAFSARLTVPSQNPRMPDSALEYGVLTIAMDNRFDGKAVVRDGIFFSSKRVGAPGIGLTSIRAVARAYQGDARFAAAASNPRSM